MAKPRPEKRPRKTGPIADRLAKRWEQLALSPRAWLASAEILRACAETIGQPFIDDLTTPPSERKETVEGVPRMLFGQVFLLLAGYTIEALLKGILVAREPIDITKGSLPDWITKHNPVALLEKGRIEVDEPLLDFIRRTNAAVVWSGRYPVPKHRDDMDTRISVSADASWFQDLYAKLEAALEQEISRLPETGTR
jgi:hypothetical protein